MHSHYLQHNFGTAQIFRSSNILKYLTQLNMPNNVTTNCSSFLTNCSFPCFQAKIFPFVLSEIFNYEMPPLEILSVYMQNMFIAEFQNVLQWDTSRGRAFYQINWDWIILSGRTNDRLSRMCTQINHYLCGLLFCRILFQQSFHLDLYLQPS